jgi:hypothetical protein
MDQQSTTKNKQVLSRNDFLFACGMLVVCCIFLVGLIALPIWFSNESQQIISANATSTAHAVATQRAHLMGIAVSPRKEWEEYEFIDRFDKNEYHWAEESIDDEYSTARKSVTGGVYLWELDQVKQPFVAWEQFYRGVFSSNYDVYVDTRIIEGISGIICSGLIFGMSDSGFDGGTYVFLVCNNSTYYLGHYNEKDSWQAMIDYSYHPSIRADTWNRLEISSRGATFVAFINGEMVYETIDPQYAKGNLAVMVSVNDGPARIEFDNFGYQSR